MSQPFCSRRRLRDRLTPELFSAAVASYRDPHPQSPQALEALNDNLRAESYARAAVYRDMEAKIADDLRCPYRHDQAARDYAEAEYRRDPASFARVPTPPPRKPARP